MSDWRRQTDEIRGMALPVDLVADLDDGHLVAAYRSAPVADRSTLLAEIKRRGLDV